MIGQLGTASLTMLVTILAGVAVYAFGQFIVRLWIEPLEQYRKAQTETVMALERYSKVLTSAPMPSQSSVQNKDTILRLEAEERLPALAGELRTRMDAMRGVGYGLWRAMGLVPDAGDLEAGCNSLHGLAVDVTSPGQSSVSANRERLDELRRLLRPSR